MAGTGGITDGLVAGARRAVVDDLAAQATLLARVVTALDRAVLSTPAVPSTWQGAAARAFATRRDELARRLLLAEERADDARGATLAGRTVLGG
ncbi:hypothetical protein [Desertivibrio insolitus]|uniref:hypothetical protein n=1 Tax=Herbiconiux sp. SYSU D00978 TaxID=2812562 RepID=UPI001A958B41|nr:hypothetical protein [Herbiconiux sp. SYSU D00978]